MYKSKQIYTHYNFKKQRSISSYCWESGDSISMAGSLYAFLQMPSRKTIPTSK